MLGGHLQYIIVWDTGRDGKKSEKHLRLRKPECHFKCWWSLWGFHHLENILPHATWRKSIINIDKNNLWSMAVLSSKCLMAHPGTICEGPQNVAGWVANWAHLRPPLRGAICIKKGNIYIYILICHESKLYTYKLNVYRHVFGYHKYNIYIIKDIYQDNKQGKIILFQKKKASSQTLCESHNISKAQYKHSVAIAIEHHKWLL